MKMEPYKNNMAECTHSGAWQENMFGRICEDCGFDTFCNDYGMYDNQGKSKGSLKVCGFVILNKVKELYKVLRLLRTSQ